MNAVRNFPKICEKLWRLWIGFKLAEMFFQGWGRKPKEHLFDRFIKIGHWAWPFSLFGLLCFDALKSKENCITILPPDIETLVTQPLTWFGIFFCSLKSCVTWEYANKGQKPWLILDSRWHWRDSEILLFFAVFIVREVFFKSLRKSRSIPFSKKNWDFLAWLAPNCTRNFSLRRSHAMDNL